MPEPKDFLEITHIGETTEQPAWQLTVSDPPQYFATRGTSTFSVYRNNRRIGSVLLKPSGQRTFTATFYDLQAIELANAPEVVYSFRAKTVGQFDFHLKAFKLSKF